MKKSQINDKVLEKTRSSRPEVFCEKGVLRNFTKFTGKHLCQSPFFNKVAECPKMVKHTVKILQETLAQEFSSEFCEIPKNNFSYRTPLVAASGSSVITWNKKHVD